ncbi:unnamed protein product, partial [Choristocarpus tenellus]
QAYGAAGRWEDALAIPHLLTAPSVQFKPDTILFCSIISACGEGKAWREAVAVVQSMRENAAAYASAQGGAGTEVGTSSGAESYPPHPDVAVYGCACRACALSGQWEAVLGLIEDMRVDKVARDVGVYASLMRALAAVGEWERAISVVMEEV